MAPALSRCASVLPFARSQFHTFPLHFYKNPAIFPVEVTGEPHKCPITASTSHKARSTF